MVIIAIESILNNKGKVDEQLLQDAIVKTGLVASDGSRLFLKSNEGMYWETLGNKANSSLRKALFSNENQGFISKRLLDRVIENLTVDSRLVFDKGKINPPQKVNLLNGVLDLPTLKLVPHEQSRDFFDYIINVSYNYQARFEQRSTFYNFICASTGCGEDEKKLNYVFENIGYLLSNIDTIRQAVLFVGPAASGKSTLATFIESLLPQDKLSAVALHELSSRFKTIRVAQAKLNSYKEGSFKTIKDWSTFKTLSAKEGLEVEAKGRDPFMIKPSVQLLFCSNGLPVISEANTDAVLERFNIILFTKSLKDDQRDPQLLTKLQAEKDVVVSWAFQNFSKALARNGVFSTPEDTKELMNLHKLEQESTKTFIEERLTFDKRSTGLHWAEIINAYKTFCQNNALSINPVTILKNEILTTFNVKTSRFRANGKNARGPSNICFKNEFIDEGS